jgi:hypothetical protein
VTAEVVLHLEHLARGDADEIGADLDLDAEPCEGRQHRHEVGRIHVLHRDVASGDRGEPDEAGDLDVIGADAPAAAV